ALAHLLSGAMNELALWIAQQPDAAQAAQQAWDVLERVPEGVRRGWRAGSRQARPGAERPASSGSAAAGLGGSRAFTGSVVHGAGDRLPLAVFHLRDQSLAGADVLVGAEGDGRAAEDVLVAGDLLQSRGEAGNGEIGAGFLQGLHDKVGRDVAELGRGRRRIAVRLVIALQPGLCRTLGSVVVDQVEAGDGVVALGGTALGFRD